MLEDNFANPTSNIQHPTSRVEDNEERIRVMFVCMGNICRSPLAEGVLRHLARELGVLDRLDIASSGTGAWHVGQHPDRRMAQTARKHGVSLDGQRAQQFAYADLENYDYILAMDRDNLAHIRRMDRKGRHASKISLFRSFDPDPGDGDVPDPYYGGPEGFERVYQIVDRTCRRLLNHLIETEGLAG